MASTQTRFSDKGYRNWVKGTLCLLYLKEGIEDVIDAEAVNFHKDLQVALGIYGSAPQICFACTPKHIKKDHRQGMWKMACTLCNDWLQQIVQNHVNQPLPNLNTENTEPQYWPTRPYDVFKCYMSYGCQRDQSAKDGDAQSILSLLKNCVHFTNCGKIGRLDLVEELLRIRNSLFHSGKFDVTDTDLQANMKVMLDFLAGMKLLSPVETLSVQHAVDKIQELKKNILDVTFRELELIALKQKQIALENDLKNLKHEVTGVTSKTTLLDDAVKTVQKDVGPTSSKVARIETDVKSLQQEIHRIQGFNDQFCRFLQANDLETDLTRLSTVAEQQSQTLEKHSQQLTELNSSYKQQDEHINSLHQRQQQTEARLQAQQKGSQTYQFQIQSLQTEQTAHGGMLQSHQSQIAQLQAQANSEQKTTEKNELEAADIASLQKCLKDYYRMMCLTVPNPMEDDDVGLNCVYVDPDIRVLRETTDPNFGLVKVEDKATPVSPCRRLFYTKDYRCKQIYITGDAGSGKSMFCRQLLNLWCEAHDDIVVDDESSRDCGENSASRKGDGSELQIDKERKKGQQENTIKEENRNIISQFTFLFYVTLRDVTDEYHIGDMIDSEILQQNDEMQHFNASDLLKKACCLIILDGLDEWARPAETKAIRFLNPGIPGRNRLNKSNVFLTTTRPWKLDVLCLKSSEIDKHIEIVGFNKVASKTLYSQLIQLWNKQGKAESYDSFWAALEKKGLSHLHTVPVILTQLICLWLDDQEMSQSQVELYCSMLEMLLKRSNKGQPDQICTTISHTGYSEMLLPECFVRCPCCQVHQNLLLNLSKVAFDALFNQERERSLVFISSQMNIFGVDKQSIDLSLKTGILSQNKVLGKRSVCEKRMSFLHKKLHEFLAAIFIANNESGETVMSRVKGFCNTVEMVLEMAQVWMFVSGIKPDLSLRLMTDLINRVVFEDNAVKQYRQTLGYPYLHTSMQYSIQRCIIDAVIEARSHGVSDFCLRLEDFVINHLTYSECLKNLFTSNISTVRSLYIQTYNIPDDDAIYILCQLQHTQCLQKLFLHDSHQVVPDMTLCETINKHSSNLTSLILWSTHMTTNLSSIVSSTLEHLTALELFDVTLTHEQEQHLLTSLSKATILKELTLGRANCTDDTVDDCRPCIDMSGLTQLHRLDLIDMNIDRLSVGNSVAEVTMGQVTIPEKRLRQFIRELSLASTKVTVKLNSVTVIAEGENRVDLTYIRHDDKLFVKQLEYNDTYNTCWIEFHTRQQTTKGTGNMT